MATQTSSDPAPAHPVFSDLLNFLSSIQTPACNTIDGGACALSSCDGCNDTYRLDKLKEDVIHIQNSLHRLGMFEQNLGNGMEPLRSRVNESGILAEPGFKEVVSAVKQLKFQLPYTSYYEFPPENGHPLLQDPPAADTDDSISDAQQRSNFEALELNQKKCLWCFSVFPENKEIKKRVLINWWVGEGLLPEDSSKSSVEKGEEMLKLLQGHGFIQQVEKKRRKLDRWRMSASARSLLKSEEQTLQVNEKLILSRNGTDPDLSQGKKDRTVFNVDKPVIGDNEVEIFSAMKNLAVLHLERSQVKGLKLITERLQKKKKKQLRLLSLAGILSIRELPDAVCHLTSLEVLDLRACQALQLLPSGMGRLKRLTHLDVSGCHILRQMPDQIKSLTCLEVLKGFVVRPDIGCSLGGLGKLPNLHKLSLSVFSKDFPTHRDQHDLASIKGLLTLKIVWKPALPQTGNEGSSPAAKAFTCCWFTNQTLVDQENTTHVAHLIKLQKLDLWFPPEKKAEFLLDPNNFPALKKFYIRGAVFDQLHYNHSNDSENWDKVEILRLLRLPQLKMNWKDLHDLFPGLSYLEVHDCNNLQLSECDHEGVWTKQNP